VTILLQQLADGVAAARRLGASDVELSHAGRTLDMTRFANSALTQSGVVIERTTRVRVALGQRLGAATTSALDAASLEAAAARALEAARLSPPSPDFPGFAPPATPAPAPAVSAPSAAAAPDRAALLAGIFRRAAADGLVVAGALHSGPRQRAVVTAAGVALEHEADDAQLTVIALDGPASGHATACSSHPERLDADALADAACRAAVRARGATALAPAATDVVLAPTAVAELLEWLALGSFSARAVLDGTSLLAGRAGVTLVDERISVVDDAGLAHPDAPANPFDAEGTPRARVTLIDHGRAGTPFTDRATAARLHTTSTGHAPPVNLGVDLTDGPVAATLALLPGADSLDDLIGRVERGLYITRFHYVNGLLDTRRAVMTGMTRDGLFEIRDGQLGQAVQNLRFTESILDALCRVGGVGRDLHAVPGSWIPASACLCPALLLRAFTFTGSSR
jgi:predicted Zn-dependent protease